MPEHDTSTSDWSCPTCDDAFSTERGMKIHHKRVHGESIAGRDVECHTCGDTYPEKPCLIEKNTRHFCCKACRLEWKTNDNQALLDELQRLEDMLGRTPSQTHLKQHSEYNKKSYKRAFGGWNAALREAGMEPNRENYTKAECLTDIRAVAEDLEHPPKMREHDNHGEISTVTIRRKFESWVEAVQAAGLDGSHVRTYNITREQFIEEIRAVGAELGETPTKEDMDKLGAYASVTIQKRFDTWSEALRRAGFEPNVKPTVTVECTYCGEATEKIQQHVKRAENMFCNEECHWEWLREGNAPAGAEHHQSKPDTSSPEYGSGWHVQRRKARERDGYVCQRCGIDDAAHESTYGCELHVHHIEAWDEFDDPDARNKLTNLITLCASCHTKIEQLPLTPQFGLQ